MTAQENDNLTPESEAAADGAIDQGDIDSMFGSDVSAENSGEPGAESAQSKLPVTGELADDPPPIDQSSIDAMISRDGAAEPVESAESVAESAVEPTPEVAEEAGAAAVNQSDINAMFGGDDSEGDAAVAEMTAAISEEKAEAEAGETATSPPLPPVHTAAVSLEDFGDNGYGSIDPRRVTMLSDVKLRVRVELGRSRMLVEDVLQLGEGSVVELQKAAGDPVDIIVNERLIARGEVLVLNDNFCVRISEIVATDPHRVTV